MTTYLITTFAFNLLQFMVAVEIIREEGGSSARSAALFVFGGFAMWAAILIFT